MTDPALGFSRRMFETLSIEKTLATTASRVAAWDRRATKALAQIIGVRIGFKASKIKFDMPL